MFCPTCGQQQLAENVRFCSRCGFLLTGVSEVIANNGVVPVNSPQIEEVAQDSQRKRGIKQGAMIMLVGMLLIVPLLGMLHVATNTEPFIMAIAAIMSFWGGLLRIIYAYMFESKFLTGKNLEEKIVASAQSLKGNQTNQQALPPQQSIPVSDYMAPTAGSWRTTNDLVKPSSVTEQTTNLLEKEID
ncbi:MAG: zinc ribbon domain-containing protein [Acidobacteriota bacterium]